MPMPAGSPTLTARGFLVIMADRQDKSAVERNQRSLTTALSLSSAKYFFLDRSKPFPAQI